MLSEQMLLLFVNCFPKNFFPYMAIAIYKILVQKHVLFPYMVSQSTKF